MRDPAALATPEFAKRDRALSIVEQFDRALGCARTPQEVEPLVARTQRELLALQGRPEDRAYLARTLCRMATALRRRHLHSVSRQLMEWGMEHGAVDSYICSELIQACL